MNTVSHVLPELLQPVTIEGPAGLHLKIGPAQSKVAQLAAQTIYPLVHLIVELEDGALTRASLGEKSIPLHQLRDFLGSDRVQEELLGHYLPMYSSELQVHGPNERTYGWLVDTAVTGIADAVFTVHIVAGAKSLVSTIVPEMLH